MEKKFNLIILEKSLMQPDLLRKKIRKLLKEKKLSISKAERTAGIGSTVLRGFLMGKTQNPQIETLSMLSKILEIEVSELLEQPSEELEERYRLPWKGRVFSELCDILLSLTESKGVNIPNFEAFPILEKIYYTICNDEENRKPNKEFIEMFLKQHFKELQ